MDFFGGRKNVGGFFCGFAGGFFRGFFCGRKTPGGFVCGFSGGFYFWALVSTPVDFVSGFFFGIVLRLKKIHLRNPQGVETSKSTGAPELEFTYAVFEPFVRQDNRRRLSACPRVPGGPGGRRCLRYVRG